MNSFYNQSSDDEAVGSQSTIVVGRPNSQDSRPSTGRAVSSSRSRSRGEGTEDSEVPAAPPKFIHRPSIASFVSEDDEENVLPSARKGLPQVETETVSSVALLGVPQQGSLKIKKSSDQMGGPSGSNSLSGSRAPSRARRKRLAAASRADIFAAKIASAMDEVASSDSDETFVYDTNRDSVRRPYNLRTSSTISLPVSPHPKGQRNNSALYVQTVTGSGPPTVAHPSPSRTKLTDPVEERGRRRPFLTESSRHMSANKNDSVRAKHVYLNRWRGGDLDDEDEDDDGGPLIDENTPLSHSARPQQHATPTPHDYGANRRMAPLYVRVTLWFVGLAMCGMFCTFVVGVLVASSRPLVGASIARLVDVFPSDKELVLGVILQAKNPGCFTVTSSQVDLDLFATSQYAPIVPPFVEENAVTKRTVLLGNVQETESTFTFAGSFFNPQNAFSMATIRLVEPCGNATELWQQISSNTFELTVRGVLKYSLLFSQDLRAPITSSIVVTGPDDR